MKLIGKVKSGLGQCAYWILNFESYYTKKAGFKLFPGSLNIELKEEFNLINPIRLEKSESGMEDVIVMQQCEIFGRMAYILRTEPYRNSKILEIVTDIKLRDFYNLEDGDEVEIKI